MKLFVCISLDVEEEGLFSGNYPRTKLSVTNVAYIKRLAPLWDELGFPLTLFCAYPVFSDASARKTVLWMRDNCQAEIGAHLHHWSTPPLNSGHAEAPVRTHLMRPMLLRQRLRSLLSAGAKCNGTPLTSFRMGRWDLKNMLLPMLAEEGIRVDSSICPLRVFSNGADHFLAPADPYWVQTSPGRRILEAPVTQIPLWHSLARAWHKAAPGKLMDSFHFFGALSANPFWHRPAVCRWAARLHALRGGHVLNFFWHSSEMMPHGSPHVPDTKTAEAMLRRIFEFCRWLRKNHDVQPVTATQLAKLPLDYPVRGVENPMGDW